MKYELFIGRWQPPHNGHKWLWEQKLAEGKNVLVAIRDVPPDDKQPFSADQVKQMIEIIYKDDERVKVIIIPDIASVNYGRGVGYDVNELKPNADIARISATEIRSKIRSGDESWRELVDPKIQWFVWTCLAEEKASDVNE